MENYDLNLNNDVQIEEKNLNFIQKLTGVIISPAETMKSLISKPRILIPFIMIAVVAILLLLLNFDAYKDYLRINSAATYEKMNLKMTSEQLDQAANFGSISGFVSIPIGYIITWIIGTLILFGLIKVFKGEGTFVQFLSITGYSYVILILGQILTGLVSFMSGIYNVSSITNLSVILPESMKGSFLYGVISGIELFTFWNYFVVSIGVVMVSKLSKTKVYTVFGIIIGASLLFGGLGQSLSGLFK